jgi:hypothetical protein
VAIASDGDRAFRQKIGADDGSISADGKGLMSSCHEENASGRDAVHGLDSCATAEMDVSLVNDEDELIVGISVQADMILSRELDSAFHFNDVEAAVADDIQIIRNAVKRLRRRLIEDRVDEIQHGGLVGGQVLGDHLANRCSSMLHDSVC